MPLMADVRAFLDQLAANRPAPVADPAAAVAASRAGYRLMQPQAPELAVGSVTDQQIPGPAGLIPVRVYRPAANPGGGPLAVIVNFHGGGFVIGDLDTADAQCREMCRRTAAVVVSVDYRLAPEHRFPAAAEDCFAATSWVAAQAAALGVDATRLAVAGDSAGGNLAAVVAMMARDRGGPAIAFQLLVYPVTDCNFDTGSYRSNGDGYLLTAATMRWFFDHYAPPPIDRTHPHLSPLRASSFANLPPALVMTAEFDPLRDEGEAYAQRLRESGVAAQALRMDGHIHGFFATTRQLPSTVPAMEQACAALRQALAKRA